MTSGMKAWESRKRAKTAYLEIWAKSEVERLGLKSEGAPYPRELRKFVAELIDVYCSHSLPFNASISRATSVKSSTVQHWRKTVSYERGQYVPNEVRWHLDTIETPNEKEEA